MIARVKSIVFLGKVSSLLARAIDAFISGCFCVVLASNVFSEWNINSYTMKQTVNQNIHGKKLFYQCQYAQIFILTGRGITCDIGGNRNIHSKLEVAVNMKHTEARHWWIIRK